MEFTRSWFSPLVAACMLFLAGVIFGVGKPIILTVSSISMLLHSFAAFGTLLIGIAAYLGVNTWRQQESSKRKADLAMTLLENVSQVEDQLSEFLYDELIANNENEENYASQIKELDKLTDRLTKQLLAKNFYAKILSTEIHDTFFRTIESFSVISDAKDRNKKIKLITEAVDSCHVLVRELGKLILVQD